MRVLNAFDIFPETFSFATVHLHPFFLLGVFSFFLTLLGGWVFKRISDQERLGALTRQLQVCLLELRLPNLGAWGFLTTQGEILVLNFRYLQASLLPSSVIILPIMMSLVSFQGYFAYAPVGDGEIFSVDILQEVGSPGRPELARDRMPKGLVFVEADSLRPRWVFRAEREGEFTIPFRYENILFTKQVVVSRTLHRVSIVNNHSSWLDLFLDSGEESLPPALKGVIREVRLNLEPIVASRDLFGWRMGWLSFFFLTSLIFLLLTKIMFRIR